MTRITYTHHGKVYRLKIEGHSGYGSAGSDIVCAAISSHLYTLIAAMPESLEKLEIDEAVPMAEVIMHSRSREDAAVFVAIAEGLRLIAAENPDFATFTSV